MQKKWAIASCSNRAASQRLREELGISAVLADLLANRGVAHFEDARRFFRPDLSLLHDPFLMRDMDKAIARIEQAIGNKEKVLIYGDYDVDGTTAVAVVYSFFRQFHSRLEFYLPDRYAEGYGISFQGIDYAAENGFTLIIALDCGIKALDKVAYAREKGIDFIIGDHHLPGPLLPEAVAVLDPKRSDCPYPYKELPGCGIGFKIIQAFIQKNNMDINQCYQYLDLVAVGIASDIVPITGENRILTYFGLQKLNSNPCCGLQSLIDLSTHRSGHFTVNDIIFQIGPRINAAGRIDHAKDAVKLLISKSLQEAAVYSSSIDEQNSQRKDFDLRITEEALAIIDGDEVLQQRKSTVVFRPDWHKGVIGIVATRLTEKYYRPTVVLTQTNGHVSGSARSVVGFDLYEALNACSDLLDQFGGHKYAAGLTMKPENIAQFEQRFEEVVAASILPGMLQREMLIDAILELSDIDAKFFRILRQFEPFGPQNEAPLFVSKKVQACGPAMVVGGSHLKMSIRQKNTAVFDCIGFGLGAYAEAINTGRPFDVCYAVEENVWRDKRSIQLNVKDIRI
ncbi:single-stranded-DNA-specific exonuclease RecJ [Parapedobacter sp. ISTM3]|uniref:Single-stranded-DNA-specific exonuclease RecJ n=1 Tax=Parapedobacter luteus TaxID=623280 RepID=A0A1T5DUJ6_9SPHI|nr:MULTISPECIES: single-stranded-DNA-specific exonuclease RecJ [Parapedobacter]MBK1440784.1 single-stranded-DNA-specific exonuclease RecJ [Parapedobacter sp. ISTM3]SKB75458.1 single-stranded-DNA-specific exonuclease [Parapedobacter luteus]